MTSRGFTLVELLVALAVGGILSVIVYGLFDSTSDSLAEIENLSDANDRLRFATERVRMDMQMAGGMITPDGANDFLVRPVSATHRAMGIVTYQNATAGWQNNNDAFLPAVAAANPQASHDGIIVMGAYDFPVGFEVSQVTGTDGILRPIVRGVQRLGIVDPFDTTVAPIMEADPVATYVDAAFDSRVLRLIDRQGYMQFLGIGGTGNNGQSLRITWAAPLPTFKGTTDFGLEVDPDLDMSYEGALIDAFWYRVIPDPNDPRNAQLVRTRLCARTLLAAIQTGGGVVANPATVLAGGTCGAAEEIVIADRVADFQIWFDCAAPTAAGVTCNDDGDCVLGQSCSGSPGVCMSTGVASVATNTLDWAQPNGGACGGANIRLARRAHLRLTMYAPVERKDLRHFQFENTAGNTGVGVLTTVPTARLRTFDIDPDLEGAAPVVTLQTSFELPNFAYRNLR